MDGALEMGRSGPGGSQISQPPNFLKGVEGCLWAGVGSSGVFYTPLGRSDCFALKVLNCIVTVQD